MSAIGIVEIRVSGKTRELRFRPLELNLLEKQFIKNGINKTVPQLFQELSEGQAVVGFAVLTQIMLVGVAWEFRGSKGKTERLSEDLIGKWFEVCGENGNDSYEDLMGKALEAVMLGFPGAKAALVAAEAEVAAEEEAKKLRDVGGRPENPLTDTGDVTNEPPVSIGKTSLSPLPSTVSPLPSSGDAPTTSTPGSRSLS